MSTAVVTEVLIRRVNRVEHGHRYQVTRSGPAACGPIGTDDLEDARRGAAGLAAACNGPALPIREEL